MSNSCIKCGSLAINHNCHGRDGSDSDLCDVCYWRSRAEVTPTVTLPKVHQFYTTYSRAGYFREDVIRALNDAGIKYQEQE